MHSQFEKTCANRSMKKTLWIFKQWKCKIQTCIRTDQRFVPKVHVSSRKTDEGENLTQFDLQESVWMKSRTEGDADVLSFVWTIRFNRKLCEKHGAAQSGWSSCSGWSGGGRGPEGILLSVTLLFCISGGSSSTPFISEDCCFKCAHLAVSSFKTYTFSSTPIKFKMCTFWICIYSNLHI